jgi:putative spermidine/putrescine transport system permease protein
MCFVVFIFQAALVLMLMAAFFKYEFPTVIYEFTLESFQRFFSNWLYVDTLLRTLRIAGIITIFALLMGYPLAHSLARTRSRYERTVLVTGVLISLFVGLLERIYAWMVLLRDGGIINNLLDFLGFHRLELMYNDVGIIIASTHYLLPYSILILTASIQSISPSLEEAADGLGASRVRTFIDVTLPLSLPGILSCALLTFSMGTSAFVVPMLMGGGKVWMLSNMIYDRVIFTLNLPLGSAMSLILMLFSVVLVFFVNKLLSKRIRV